MSRLELRDLIVRFGKHTALDGCSLSIEPGELVVILGPSGCGKSTLLRSIAGLVALDAGSITIDDADVTSLPPADRDVAMVFQGYALFPHLDVARNIAFGMRARKVPEAESAKAVLEIAAALGIADLLSRRPHQLSGGERQRVALARALVRSPKLALLDEPLASLDAPLRISARAEIARLQRERGTTMIHVTHDQAEAMALGDRIVIMRDGKVVQIGAPNDIYDEPTDRFVASFVGNPPMNIVPRGSESIGVRPEHVILGSEGQSATVARVEHMGDHALVSVHLEDSTLIVSRQPRETRLQPGDRTNAAWSRTTQFDSEGMTRS